jgi:hypothetical protein
MTFRTSRLRPGRPVLGLTLVIASVIAAAASTVGALTARAATNRVLLRALVVTSGDSNTVALAAALDREGIPYTQVTVGAAGRPTIDNAFLEDASSGTGKFQAVFLPNQAGGGLGTSEIDALNAYETAYGVRQVNGYDWPSAALGLNPPDYSGTLDGASVTVTSAGLSGPFRYLKGSLTIDDIDPNLSETYGYLSQPLTSLPAEQSITPLLTATVGSTSGVIAGVYAHDGREELALPVAFNQNMQWFDEIAPGILSWATRGIHLGHQRNYFNVQIDDVFLPDSRWSITGTCTPGDNCVDPSTTTTDIRMTPTDEAGLVSWQNAHGFKIDMVFNGGGSEAAKAAGNGTDPLTTAFLTDEAQFRWINHTYAHPFLGCIQIAPAVIGETWHCATSPSESPRMDTDIADTMSDGIDWAAQSAITQQVGDNITWARNNHLTNFDAGELVTGEHSGLVTLPQQTTDNPFFAPALASLGVKHTASDASRETDPRPLAGGASTTVPRHPMNIFYNAGTYQDEVSEYNWIYTSSVQGGSGICENDPASTCITPLAASDNATAKASFDGYLKPIEVRNALRYVLTNDPRPFFAHQSNLAEDGILYPVLEGVLSTYRSVYDATTTPLVQTGLTGQSQAMSRLDSWRTAASGTGFDDGYVDGSGVHLPAASVAVPVTVPAGSTGASLDPYAGSLSGWVSGGTTITLPTTGGYLVQAPATVPGTPAIGTTDAGSTTATVRWTPPESDGGSPLSGYVVRIYASGHATPSESVTAAADSTSTVVTGLDNGTAYRFDVAAVNAVGTGQASALSSSVTPQVSLAPLPQNVTADPGNTSATVTWTAPSNASGVTGYRIRAYTGTATTVARSVTVAAGLTSAPVTGLVNDTAYTFTVASTYRASTGPESARSAAVTPTLISQTASAPSLSTVTQAPSSIAVTWQPPADGSYGTPSGYQVSAYLGSTTKVAKKANVAGTATSGTVTGLANGTAYTVSVTVVYASGTGPSSARSAAVIPTATVPGAPIIGSASSGKAGKQITATARWSAPTTDGGSAITGYQVIASHVAANGSVLGTTTSAAQPAGARSLTMTLPANGQYSFTVVAINAVGTSVPSTASNIVTAQ